MNNLIMNDLMMKEFKEETIIVLFILIPFIGLFISCIFIFVNTRRYRSRTIGEIISVRESCYTHRGIKSYTYFATYRYMVGEDQYEYEASIGESSKELLPIGKKVELKYLEKNPYKFIAVVDDKYLVKSIYGSGIVLVIMALVVVYIIIKRYNKFKR